MNGGWERFVRDGRLANEYEPRSKRDMNTKLMAKSDKK